MFIPIQKKLLSSGSLVRLQQTLTDEKNTSMVGKGGPGSGRYPAGSGGQNDPLKAESVEELNHLVGQNPKYQVALQKNSARGDSRNDLGVLDKNGNYTVEAHTQNLNVANSMLNPNSRVPFGEKPNAVLMLGKPGSGKSTLRSKLDLDEKYTVIDADKIMEHLPGYEPDLAGAYHERAADIAEKYMLRQVVGNNMNFVLDATGKSASKMLDVADHLKELGYNIHVVHASLPDLEAGKRAFSRWQKGGRLVPIDFVTRKFGDRPHNTYQLLKEHYAQTAREYDTSTREQIAKGRGSGGRYGGQLGRGCEQRSSRIGKRKARIRKYSPDQPRDDHGRFGTGSVVFEVAPNPDDIKASEKWNSLSREEQLSRSQDVAEKLVPQILAAKGIKGGEVKAQIGSYQDDTNRSFTLELPDSSDPTSVVDATKTLGFNLSQKSMMTTSNEPFPGSSPVEAVILEGPKDFSFGEAKSVYDTMRGIKVGGINAINGQTTVGNKMSILNFDKVMDTDKLAEAVKAALPQGTGYKIHTEQINAWFATQEADYGHGYTDYQTSAGRMEGQPISEASRDFRGAVTAAITKALKFLTRFYPGIAPQQDRTVEAALISSWRNNANLVEKVRRIEKVGPTINAVHSPAPMNSKKKKTSFSIVALQKRRAPNEKSTRFLLTVEKAQTHPAALAFQALHKKYQPQAAAAFQAVVDKIKSQINMPALIHAIESRNIHHIVQTIIGDKFEKYLSGEFKGIVFEAYHAGSLMGAGQLRNQPVQKGGLGSGPRFSGRTSAKDVFRNIMASQRAQEGIGKPAIRHDQTGEVFPAQGNEIHNDIIDRVSDQMGGTTDFRDFTQGFVGRGGSFIPRDMADREARRFVAKAGMTGDLDITNSLAVEYLANDLPELITEINADQAAAVQSILLDGINGGMDGPEIASQIKNVVGLTQNQAQWVMNFRQQLEDGINGNFTPVDERRLSAVDAQMAQDEMDAVETNPEVVNLLVENYAASLTAKRAMDISVSEIHSAFIQGQHQLWLKAKDLGYLDPGITRRHWLGTHMENEREAHLDTEDMNEPDGVGLEEPFDTPVGDVMNPGDSGDDGFDDNCHCTVFLTFNDKWGSGSPEKSDEELNDDEEDEDADTE